MDVRQYLGQYEFQAVAGPARVAYLISPQSETGFRRAVSESCTRWGGKTEPIVPVHSKGRVDKFSLGVLRFSGIDSLVNVDADPTYVEILSSKLDLPHTNLVDIDRKGPGQFTCNPAAVAPITGLNLATYAAPSLDLWTVAGAGTFTSAMITDQRANPGLVRQSNDGYEIFRGQLSRTNAVDVTCEQFGEWLVVPPPTSRSTVIWICSRRQFLDCVNFWNYRAIQLLSFDRGNVVLLCDYKLHFWNGLDQQIRWLLENRPDEFDPDAILFSLSTPTARLDEIATSWGLKPSDQPVRSTNSAQPPPARQAPFTYRTDADPRDQVMHQRRNGVQTRFQVQSWQGPIKLHLPSPVSFQAPGRIKLGIGSNLFNRLPKRPSIAEMIIRPSKWTGHLVEIFVSAQSEYRVDLSMPLMSEVVKTLATDAAKSFSLSDKGKLAESIARRFDISQLMLPGVVEAIHSLTTKRSSYRIESRDERRILKSGQIENVAADARALTAENLVSHEFAERGLRINCLDCGISSFISFADSTSSAICPGCYRSQKYELSNGSLATFYRLNSLIDRASDQGAVLHLLALAALRHGDKDCEIRPGVNFVFADGTNRETDLFGAFNGRVVSGEVKPKPEAFSERQITRDLELSLKLGVDIHVMACFGEIKKSNVELAASIADRKNIELLVMDLKALRTTPDARVSGGSKTSDN